MTQINVLLSLDYVRIQILNVFTVREYKRFLWLKSKRYYILDVFQSHFDSSIGAVKLIIGSENILFIIGDLNDKGNVEGILKVLCEDEGDAVTHVE